MKIINLMENTAGSCGLHAEHGLSIYVETKKHKLLVDTGASARTWENAARLGVELPEIDTVFLSHGHYDTRAGYSLLQRLIRTRKFTCTVSRGRIILT